MSASRGITLSVGLATYANEMPDGWEPVLDLACRYERVGFDRVVVSDHVVLGEHLDAYADPEVGGQQGGRQPTGPDGLWLEPLTTLAVIAGRTERIRLVTGILLAALRRPVVLAKTLTTLDVLSGGRVDLGVGVGWQREEYEAAGLPFEGRGRLLDHTLEVCQTFWREPVASYASDELAFDRIHMMPKPAQPGGVPVWISGTLSRRLVTRLCRFGLRWIPWGDDAADLGRSIPALRERIRAAGVDPAPLEVVGTLRVYAGDDGAIDLDRTLAPVPQLAAAGATDVQVRLPPRTLAAASDADLAAFVAAFRVATETA